MLHQRLYSDQLTFFQKVRRFDIWLILSVLALGAIGVVAMFSSDGGQFSYYATSHVVRFSVFFSMMLGERSSNLAHILGAHLKIIYEGPWLVTTADVNRLFCESCKNVRDQ